MSEEAVERASESRIQQAQEPMLIMRTQVRVTPMSWLVQYSLTNQLVISHWAHRTNQLLKACLHFLSLYLRKINLLQNLINQLKTRRVGHGANPFPPPPTKNIMTVVTTSFCNLKLFVNNKVNIRYKWQLSHSISSLCLLYWKFWLHHCKSNATTGLEKSPIQSSGTSRFSYQESNFPCSLASLAGGQGKMSVNSIMI